MESLVSSFYKNKKVLITGHTGFKGTWLCKILSLFGADVMGYALAPSTKPNLYELSNIENEINSVIGDIRDYTNLYKAFNDFKPDIVFHLAAQPIVKEGYKNPRYTFETNLMGTVNVLECVRNINKLNKISVINVTTDKVYLNREWCWGYRENEPLDGFDPYSNSKSCSELATHSYINSYFNDMDNVTVSTARAGNVIGGGDFSKDRIIPDCVRAAFQNETILVRNPNSIRPYQHVLEPLYVYLLIAMKQYNDKSFSGYYNVGPDEKDCVTTGNLVNIFCKKWQNIKWERKIVSEPHEANFLKLDCSKLKNTFNWNPRWNIEVAIEKTVEWSKCFLYNKDYNKCMENQIKEFFNIVK